MKQVKLSVFGDNLNEMSSFERRATVITFWVVYPLLVLGTTFLYAWILDSFLNFVDFQYWEWFKLILVFRIFTLGRDIQIARITEGLKSILRRV